MWIYEANNWPNFSWDAEQLERKLADVRYKQGLLLGRMERIGFDLKQEASLLNLTEDVVKSSAIEGETLRADEVRSSIASRLGINIGGRIPSSRNVEGIVEMMLDATQHAEMPLTTSRLFDWHAALFPTGRSGMLHINVGTWRTIETGAMQVVSGPIGSEKVHFEAPDANKIEQEMGAFLSWFDQKNNIDPVLKAGIAHFWFVTIHPFEDGNGRIARAIADMGLALADGISNRYYSFSAQIESERKEYYKQLEQQQRATEDITGWLSWFLDCFSRAILRAEKTLENVLLKAHIFESPKNHSLNARQRVIIYRMLEEQFIGYINTSKYSKIAKCSPDTALRDLQSLVSSGIMIQNPGGGRSTSYSLIKDNSQTIPVPTLSK